MDIFERKVLNAKYNEFCKSSGTKYYVYVNGYYRIKIIDPRKLSPDIINQNIFEWFLNEHNPNEISIYAKCTYDITVDCNITLLKNYRIKVVCRSIAVKAYINYIRNNPNYLEMLSFNYVYCNVNNLKHSSEIKNVNKIYISEIIDANNITLFVDLMCMYTESMQTDYALLNFILVIIAGNFIYINKNHEYFASALLYIIDNYQFTHDDQQQPYENYFAFKCDNAKEVFFKFNTYELIN
jgi:hypothetical protein